MVFKKPHNHEKTRNMYRVDFFVVCGVVVVFCDFLKLVLCCFASKMYTNYQIPQAFHAFLLDCEWTVWRSLLAAPFFSFLRMDADRSKFRSLLATRQSWLKIKILQHKSYNKRPPSIGTQPTASIYIGQNCLFNIVEFRQRHFASLFWGFFVPKCFFQNPSGHPVLQYTLAASISTAATVISGSPFPGSPVRRFAFYQLPRRVRAYK